MHYIFITLIATLPLFAMDGDEETSSLVSSDEKENSKSAAPVIPHLNISIPSFPNDVAPLQRINTMDSLKKLCQSQKSSPKQPSPKEKEPSPRLGFVVTPALAAQIVHTLVYKRDPSAEDNLKLKHLEKRFEQLDAETVDKFTQHAVVLHNKYDGISALGISRYKSQKKSANSSANTTNTQSSSNQATPHTPTSSESPKHRIESLSLEQSTLKKEFELQEKELGDLKQEMTNLMAKLAKQAADDAVKEKDDAKQAAESDAAVANRLSKRSLIIGSTLSALGIVSAILTAIFTTNNNNSHACNCPNSSGI